MLIQAGAFGLDWSYDPPDIDRLPVNVKFVCRYIASISNHPKSLKPAERDALHAKGIGIVLVYESAQLNPLRGRQQGLIDGHLALVQAIAIGYPTWMPIVIAVDTAVYAAILPTVMEYIAGFEFACTRPIGIYGGSVIADALGGRSQLGWKAYAKSWSPNPNSPNFHVHQTSRTTAYLNGFVDMDRAVKDFMSWHPDTPQPPTEEPEMQQLIQIADDPAVMVTDGNYCWSAVSNAVIVANQAAGLWSPTIEVLPNRDRLAGYYWSGKPIDYSTVNPDTATALPGRTSVNQFRGYTS